MAHYTKFIELDVHKNSIAVAIADSQSSEVRFYGNIPNTLDGIVIIWSGGEVKPPDEPVLCCAK